MKSYLKGLVKSKKIAQIVTNKHFVLDS